jgi:hypothetical protein
MTGRKSRTLELLAFDEYCRFDTSAFFWEIKRARGRVNCQTRAGALRARDAWRKFTEIHGNPRGSAARELCGDFLPVIGTVPISSRCTKVPVLYCMRVWDRLFRMRKKNFLSTGPETRRKRSVCSRASKCIIKRVSY